MRGYREVLESPLLYFRAVRSRGARRVLGPRTRAILVRWSEGLIAVDHRDQVVGRTIRTTGTYEPERLQDILSYTSSTSRVLVVGAHIGAFVIPLAKHCAEVVAVEPNPDTLELLRTNLVLSSSANVEVVPVAASDRSGKVAFLASQANTGGSKVMPKARSYKYYFDRPHVLEVDAAPLDEVISETTFDLILMDVEGSEVVALRGMQKILSQCPVLVVEFIPHHLREAAGVSVTEFLEPLSSYNVMIRPGDGTRVEGPAISRALETMFDKNRSDAGLIFTRV